ncbi:MAG: transcriptional regulator [Nitrospinae bacterium]|jgi:DNA-binding phage protein|nr:transcriptional regulator [Nitrospinota bacterium]MDA1108922.1 transcriptional regulator [Nitrospinota bacterium]
MAITRHFKETIQARALRDPEFRRGLLKESIETMLAGDIETGKIILRDYINSTIGFEKLGAVTQKSPKSLMRMFSPSGNPTAKNLFSIIYTLQKKEGVQLEVQTSR